MQLKETLDKLVEDYEDYEEVTVSELGKKLQKIKTLIATHTAEKAMKKLAEMYPNHPPEITDEFQQENKDFIETIVEDLRKFIKSKKSEVKEETERWARSSLDNVKQAIENYEKENKKKDSQ